MISIHDLTAGYSDTDLRDLARSVSVAASTHPHMKCRRCKCIIRAANHHRRLCSPCLESMLGTFLVAPPVTASHTGEFLTLEIVDKFWRLAQRNGTRRCWGWKGTITRQGYAVFQVQRRILYARRVVYQITRGASAPSFLYNLCKNDSCVNPAHIAQGRKERQ